MYSSIVVTSGGSANLEVIPYDAPVYNTFTETANAQILDIQPSTFIRERNAFEQKPLVRLYTIYYPGEWYPSNSNGNPTLDGAGMAWPIGFPLRFAEIRGDIISDLQYRILYDAVEYQPFPINSTGVQVDSTGKINEIDLLVSNFENLISVLIEDPFLVGNNASNAESAIVNGETVTNIDPRTIIGNPLFDQDIVDARGGNNLAFDFSSTEDVNGEWTALKTDTRDLLGGVIEIRTTFANFLDFWPEYSTVRSEISDAVEVYNQMPYRVGDLVTNNSNSTPVTINSIDGNILLLSDDFPGDIGDRVYIVNDEANPENFILDTFKINSMDGLDENAAKFSLSSWLQFFKLQLPKRRYFKNSCSWTYKQDECQYPEDGTGAIPGDLQGKTANGFFNINNTTEAALADDVCARNLQACGLRNNELHYGGFQGTGRTLPRQ